MAMLNQIHALRSWDIGGWLGGECQRAQISLELGARGHVEFARRGILASVRGFGVCDRKKYPHLDGSIELLDTIPEQDRKEIVLELIGAPRVLWNSANDIIEELSDAIPVDALESVAKWSGQLELDEYHSRWTVTRVAEWEVILHWAPNAAELVQILKPVLIVKAANPMCWDKLHGTLISAIIKGTRQDAEEILRRLLDTQCTQGNWNQYRFSIVMSIAEHRPELSSECVPWLEENVKSQDDQYFLFLLRRIGVPDNEPSNDPEFGKWLRDALVQHCDKKLAETGRTFSIGGSLAYHKMAAYLKWPRSDPELVKKLVEVVDATYVPFVNKFEPIACLAVLALNGPKKQARSIAKVAMKWLDTGIDGREGGFGGPLSTGQMIGWGPEAIVSSFAYLLDVLAKNHSDIVAHRMAKCFLVESIRRPLEVVDFTIRTTLHLSIALFESDEALSTALVAIADSVAHTGMNEQSTKVISGFADVVFNEAPMQGLTEWLSSPVGQLCVEMWERRLADASLLANPSVRACVARTIQKWGKSELAMAAILEEARERLAQDCRLRVRAAIEGKQ